MRIDQIVELASGPAVATDSDNRVVSWNSAARRLFGYGEKHSSVAGKRLHELMSISDVFGNPYKSDGQPFWELAIRGEPVNNFELKVSQPGGQGLRVSVAAVVVLGPDSRYWVVYLMRPIFRRRRADEAIDRLLSMPGAELQKIRGRGKGGEPLEHQLTRREVEVLRLLSQGSSSEEIAHALKVSVNTVRSHVQHVLTKLDAHSKLEAVAKAIQKGLF